MEIKEYDSSRISKPNVIVGVPEAGLVGTIAASYIAQQMKLPEAGYIESDLIPPVVVIHESKPHNPIRILGLNNIAIIMSEVPLPPKLAVELGSEVVRWAKTKNSELLIGITSVPFEGRMEHAEEGKTPRVLASPCLIFLNSPPNTITSSLNLKSQITNHKQIPNPNYPKAQVHALALKIGFGY